jgi:uncharacterized protein (DUF305 family)
MSFSKWPIISVVLCSVILFSACSPAKVTTVSPAPQHQTDHDMAMHEMTVKDEKDFIWQMIPHHQEAIDTSKLIAAETTDAELKKFATDVITLQTQEVESMKGWYKTWYQQEYTANTSYVPMMGDLKTPQGRAREKAYVEGMIHHHQGAIEMAKQVLTMNPRPEVKKMAEDIISVQQQEVDMLQGWLKTKYSTQESVHTPTQN